MKKEAAFFKQYWSKLEARAKKWRKREELKHQDEFLKEAYQEAVSLKDEERVVWDPIEDVVADERAT